VHGDGHSDNLLRDRNDQVVLCDFDPTCRGPWQLDLVAVAVGEARFGHVGAHRRLRRRRHTDPDWPLLREAGELNMIAAATSLLISTPGIADEFHTRLRSVKHSGHSTRWTPFADLRRR
jgi:hypothetical protein